MKFSDIILPSNKKFGIVISSFLFLLSIYFIYNNIIYLSIIFLAISSIILSITFIKPALLTNLNKGWMLIGFILGKVVNPLVLGLIFFAIITPLGFFLRIIGRDELNIKNNYSNSFWEQKELKKYDPNSFKNQF